MFPNVSASLCTALRNPFAAMCALALCQVLGFAPPASAQAFFVRDGAAIGGYDPVAYFTEGKAVKGNAEWVYVHQGARFQFASTANRERFAQSPERYAPQFGGYCAYGVTRGYKAAVDGEAFSVVDGKLYLNYNRDVAATWSRDRARLIELGVAKWSDVAKTTHVIQ